MQCVFLFRNVFPNNAWFFIDLIGRPLRQEIGFPNMRVRTYGVGINNSSLIWVGPCSNDEIKKDFFSFFRRTVMLDGDSYVGLDSAAHAEQLREHMAQLRGVYQAGSLLPFEALLCPGYRETWGVLVEMLNSCTKVGISGCLVGDLSQSPSRLRAGHWLPAFQRGTMLASVSKQHLFTPWECSFAMGWPMFEFPESPLSSKLASTVPQCLRGMGIVESKRLLGNGMMLAQVTAWSVYILSHVVRRDVLERLMLPRRLKRERSEQEEGGAEDARQRQ